MSERQLALPGVGGEKQADFETVVSMLPTQLNAEIEGEAGTSVVPITGWSCPGYIIDETGSWPQGGAYTFTAKLPGGYACDPLPAVRVTLGGAQAYSMPVTGDGYSFDQVTGILTISNENGTTAWRQSGSITKEAVKEVVVQDGVTSIGTEAFRECTNLKKVTFPDKLTSIGRGAFYMCSSLTEVILPASLTSIGRSAFYRCTNMKKVTFPDKLTSIGETAFLGCSSLTEVILPASLTAISNEVFSYCTSLKKAVFLGAPATLGTRMFMSCGSLTEVILPAGLTSLPSHTFDRCTSLEKITLPAGLTDIGAEAFSGCSSLTEVNLPATLTSIAMFAFRDCSSLTEIALPNNLQSIGLQAFAFTGLKTITIPPNVTSVGQWAFMDANSLRTVIFFGMAAPTFGTGIFDAITPQPTVYVPEGASGYDSLSPVYMTPPVITAQPQNVTAEAGSPATFTAAADGRPSPSLQWQVDQGSGWNAVTDGIGGDTAVYTIPAASAGMDGWKYRCVITNPIGTVITDEATLTVKVPVAGVTLDKSSLTLFVDQEVTLTAAVAPDDAADRSVSWTSDNPDVASVDANGKVTARAVGAAAITAVSNDGGKKAVCDITVIADPPANRGSSSGSRSSSGGGRAPVYGPQSIYTVTGDRISLTIPRADIQSLADSGKILELSCDTAGMTFDASALGAILAAAPAAVSITFAAFPADLSAFPDVAAFFGSRPVYDFTISSQDSGGVMARMDVNFPAGSAAISLDYTPSLLEVPGSLFMFHVDGMAWLDRSVYRAAGADEGSAGGRVLAEAPHFSTYGVAYKTPVPVFTDIAGHWAQKDIEFAAARGLLPGKGHDRFLPDVAMTRGMFAAALGRLAGVSPDGYTWGGSGDDAPVTREQMAEMMADCAVQMGYAAPLAAVPFAGNGAVSGTAADRFGLQEEVTRAEGAVALRRFVEMVIDTETAGRVFRFTSLYDGFTTFR